MQGYILTNFHPIDRWDTVLYFISEVLLTACEEYFEWVEANPILEEKVFHSMGTIIRAEVPKMRPMTITGLCCFLDIGEQTWRNYKKNKNRKGFLHIIQRVEDIMYEQKFTGAATGLLNANIISRDLGLKDQQEVRVIDDFDDDDEDMPKTPEEAERAYNEMIAGKK